MNKIQKISLVGTLIAGTALCVALPLASCASTVEVESDYFYGRLGSDPSTLRKYGFQDVESYHWSYDYNSFSFVMKASCGCASTEKVYVNEKVTIKYLDWLGAK